MGHTPGPWDRQGNTVFALDEHSRVNRFTAHVHGGYINGGTRHPFGDAPIRTDELEVFDNARLIAASPDLLEACKALLASHRPGVGQCCAASDLGIAAIAKATGAGA